MYIATVVKEKGEGDPLQISRPTVIDGRRGSRGCMQAHSYLKKANRRCIASCIHFFNVTAVNNLTHVPVLIGQVFS